MKKLLTILCILASLTIFSLTGCSNKDTFAARSYSSGDSVIESVFIDVIDRSIDIGVSTDEQVYIEYFDGEKEYFDVDVKDNTLTVKLTFNKKWTDVISTKAAAKFRKMTVKLPSTVNTLSVIATNENVCVDTIAFADAVSITNNGGNIEFDKITVGKALNLSCKNGDIKGSIIGGWDDFSIDSKIKKGDSNLPAEKLGGNKSLTVDCNNGDINIKFIK